MIGVSDYGISNRVRFETKPGEDIKIGLADIMEKTADNGVVVPDWAFVVSAPCLAELTVKHQLIWYDKPLPEKDYYQMVDIGSNLNGYKFKKLEDIKRKQRPIAREITGEDEDAYCSVCEDDTLVVRLRANVSVNDFNGGPGEIYLCQNCLARMEEEISALNKNLIYAKKAADTLRDKKFWENRRQ